jgi:uncharacterized membrane protein
MFLISHEDFLAFTIVGGVLLIASMILFVVIAWQQRGQ